MANESKADEQKAAMEKAEKDKAEPMTKIDLPKARVIGRRIYGPGYGIEVPTRIVEAFKKQDDESGRTALRERHAAQAKKK